MLKDFFKHIKPSNNIAFIYNECNQLKKISYKEFINYSLNIQKKFKKNKLTLFICDNSFESILIYFTLINNNNKLLLIDPQTNISFIKKYIKIYKPYYVISKKKNILKKYKNEIIFNEFNVLTINNNDKININKNILILLSTSGTTGTPKFCKISKENILDNTINIIKYLRISKKNKTILTLPISYSFGLSVLNTHLYAQATIILNTHSITESFFWNLVKQTKPNNFSFVPFQLEIIKKFKLYKLFNYKILYFAQAGGKMDNDNLNFFLNYSKEKKIKFYIMYGQTEASPRMSYLDPKYSNKKFGSIGKPIPGGKFYLIDEKGNKIIKSNVVGELIYKGKNVCLGISKTYKDLTNKQLSNDILNTGDMAYFDEEGFYFISGRKKRFAKIYGKRINLDELQNLISSKKYQLYCKQIKNKIIIFFNHKIDKKHIINKLFKLTGINKNSFDFKSINKIPITKTGKIIYDELRI